MNCSNKKCNVSGDERMVSCWLCMGNYHMKCSNLKARDADALLDASKHLHWTCPDCRIIGVEFYNFFKSQKTEFECIKNDFIALQCKLSKYGELFTNYKNLENFIASPTHKRRKSTKSTSTSPNFNFAVKTRSQNLPVNSQIQNLNVAGQTSNCNPAELTSVTPSTSQKASINAVRVIEDGQPTSPFVAVNSPKPLRTLPARNKRKSIFATRFVFDTSVNDIEAYIKGNIAKELYNDIQIFKINSRNRASFKILVPVNIFEKIVDPGFWPENTHVREFIYHDNNNVILTRHS